MLNNIINVTIIPKLPESDHRKNEYFQVFGRPDERKIEQRKSGYHVTNKDGLHVTWMISEQCYVIINRTVIVHLWSVLWWVMQTLISSPECLIITFPRILSAPVWTSKQTRVENLWVLSCMTRNSDGKDNWLVKTGSQANAIYWHIAVNITHHDVYSWYRVGT